MSSMTILIVDDEEDIRVSLCEILKMAGYEVTTVASGHEALEHIGKRDVGLMLVDLSMPEMSGEELINTLWKKEKKPSILAITALAPWQTAGLLGLGIGYLRKPIDANLLLGTVRTLMRKECGNEIKSNC